MTNIDWRETAAGRKWLALHGNRAKVRTTWLTRARVLSGWTQREAAKALGLSARTWPTWEYVGKERSAPGVDAARVLVAHPWTSGALEMDLLYDTPYVWVRPATLEVLSER